MSAIPRCLPLLVLAACTPRQEPPTSLPAGTQLVRIPTVLAHPDPAQPLKVQALEVPLAQHAERPPGIAAIPEAPAPMWFTATVVGHPIRLAVVDQGNDRATLYADLDGNGDLTGAGEKVAVGLYRRGPLWVYNTNLLFKFAEVEVKPLLQRTVRGVYDAVALVACHREGKAVVQGQELQLLLLDQDLDGRYGGAGDFWLLESPKTIFRPRLKGRGPSKDSMIECGEPVWIGKAQTARLLGIDADGVARVAVGPESEPMADSLRRRHERVRRASAQLIASDSRGFLAESKLDANRPKITTPLPWLHALDLEQPLVAARAAGKPLLVYLDGDGVAACRFTDHYLMEDQEVARMLESFVLVRWNVDLDRGKWTQQFGPAEFPRWVAVAPDGRVARVITGFQIPALLLPELERGLAAALGKPPR